MHLVTRRSSNNDEDVSQDVVNQFEKAIVKCEKETLTQVTNDDKYLSLFLKWFILKFNFGYYRWNRKTINDIFCVHMGPDYGKSARYFLQSKTKMAYFFDVWPYTFADTKTFLTKLDMDFTFISSLHATEYFNAMGFPNVFWIPEGVDPSSYKFYAYAEKDIDVLELGRKYLNLHDEIAPVLAENNRSHLFERRSGEIIFPSQNAFIDGLARAKISICYPRSTTHPESAGDISTLTNRYLQSMASKCLIVGEAPSELKHLFDYDPVVPLNPNNAKTEIMRILENYDTYIPLIEKNYKTVIESHTWLNRWCAIKKILGSKPEKFYRR